MKEIDLNTWVRKEHFEYFIKMDDPEFGITDNLDISAFLKFIKERNLSFFISVIFFVMKTVNS